MQLRREARIGSIILTLLDTLGTAGREASFWDSDGGSGGPVYYLQVVYERTD